MNVTVEFPIYKHDKSEPAKILNDQVKLGSNYLYDFIMAAIIL